jgi:putative transposase
MTNYRRNFISGGSFFFTVNLADRSQRLLVENIEALRQAFRTVKADQPFDIVAMVVLPEHLHTIWTLPPGDADYSTRWKKIKAEFSGTFPKSERRSASRISKGERGIWQRRYWEHTLRDHADFNRHFDYIHFNPVKHGLTKQVIDWPYSSFHRYVRLEIYPPDWAWMGEDVRETEFGENL